MEHTNFIFQLSQQDKRLLDASAHAVQKTKSAYLRHLIRNAAQQLNIDLDNIRDYDIDEKIDFNILLDTE